MTHCRFPFACSTTACEKCAAPVYEIPPETEFLRTRFAMLCAIGGLCSIIALAAFTLPNNFDSVVAAHAEDIR